MTLRSSILLFVACCAPFAAIAAEETPAVQVNTIDNITVAEADSKQELKERLLSQDAVFIYTAVAAEEWDFRILRVFSDEKERYGWTVLGVDARGRIHSFGRGEDGVKALKTHLRSLKPRSVVLIECIVHSSVGDPLALRGVESEIADVVKSQALRVIVALR